MAVQATSTSIPVAKKETTLAARQARLALLLLSPTIVLLILIAFYPLARTVTASLTDEPFARPDVPVNQVGLANYQTLLGIQIVQYPPDASLGDVLPRAADGTRYRRVSTFDLFGTRYVLAATDPDFVNSIVNTIVYTIISVAFELAIGLGVALVVNTRFRGRGMMRAVMLIPWAIPTAISTVLWRHMLGDNSSAAINAILLNLGVISQSQAWRSTYPLASVIFVDVWKTVPFMALLLLAGLQTIPGDLYEAGAVDGATVRQRFFRITLPLLMPTITIALIFRTLDALRAFDVFQVLVGRSTPSMAVYNYEKLVSSFQYGYASAIGVIIFIIIFAFTILYMSAFHVEED
ncbi:MAG: sugar ABC transporter permease [Anaerolineae bacterium]|nr:sugar ABC transporter permease [Anaerolineae bacterium]